ncbi:UNVERIFIED_CONTAM: hypothetical protein HDU68_012019 [Siphonaria sp. JEL0065]|nr:hypothetical protein HDU68_012019 [Siphonaria sp. JEL0065]
MSSSSSSIKFTLKRKAADPAPTATSASVAHAFEDAKKQRVEAIQTDGVIELLDASDVGTEYVETKGPLVIPLKLHNEWMGKVRGDTTQSVTTPKDQDDDDEQPLAPGSRPSPVPSNASSSRESLASLLSLRAGTKWGLQLRTGSSLAASPLTAPDNAVDDPMEDIQDTRTLEQRAIDALLADSTATKPNVVPILQQNAVPGIRDITDPKEKYKYDMSLRPDEATLEDFETVPIEDFGIAMLRGMGYKEEEDPNKKKEQGFVFSKPRPNLLGLGAEPPKKEAGSSSDNKKDRKSSGNSSSKSRDEPKKSSKEEKYAAGRRVKILKECKWRGEVGSILSCRVKSDGIALKIGIGRDEMRCWSEDVQLV